MSVSAPKRDYRNPHTHFGISLRKDVLAGTSSFLVHECGLLDYENWNHSQIRSPYWRLHHNAAPGNAIRFRDREYPLEPDSLNLIPDGIVFDTIGRKSVSHLWIHFTPMQSFVLTLREPLRIPLHPALHSTLHDLRALSAAIDPEGDTRKLLHLCKATLHLAFSRLDASVYQAFPSRLHALLEHIESHLDTDLSLTALASLAGMRPEQLSALFKQHLGKTPARYVTRVRLKMAMRQLTLSDDSIDQIAEDIGYPNRYYFSRVFKQHLGCGPAAFRKRQR